MIAVNLTNKETLFSDTVTVIAGNSGSLEIIWEEDDDEFDYKRLDLYGIYRTAFTVMRYEAGILKVYSNDIAISII